VTVLPIHNSPAPCVPNFRSVCLTPTCLSAPAASIQPAYSSPRSLLPGRLHLGSRKPITAMVSPEHLYYIPTTQCIITSSSFMIPIIYQILSYIIFPKLPLLSQLPLLNLPLFSTTTTFPRSPFTEPEQNRNQTHLVKVKYQIQLTHIPKKAI
jgi:hypothetical protein